MKFVFFSVSEDEENILGDEGADGGTEAIGLCPHLRFKLVLTLVRYQSFYITLHYITLL